MAIEEPFNVYLGDEFGADVQLDSDDATVYRGILDKSATTERDDQIMFLDWSVFVRTSDWREPVSDDNPYGTRDLVKRGDIIRVDGIRWKCESGLEPQPPDGVFSRIELSTFPC